MLRALQQNNSIKLAAAVAGAAACTLGTDGSILGTQTMSASSSVPAALNPQEWKAFKVAEKKQLSHNTVFVRLALPDAEQVVGLPVASCLITRAPIGKPKDGEGPGFVIRPYTPVSRPDAKGHFDLIVKVYPEGVMSKHIGSLGVGDLLECKGPIMKLEYSANMKKSIGMIAGGTGITPMYQVIEEILSNPEDETEVSLIYANVSEKDILIKDKLDALASKHSNFKVFYVVDKANLGGLFWSGGVGYITADMIKKHLPAPSDDSLVLVCGPPPMMNAISGDKAPDKTQGELTGLLASLNYDKKNVYKF